MSRDARYVLGSLVAFEGLSPLLLDDLVTTLDVRDYPEGHTFIREGDRGSGSTSIFVVLEGTIRVSREREASHELNRMTSGDLFGLVALVDDAPRSATCRAIGPCTVGAWPRSVVTLLFNQHAPIAHAFQLALGRQLARDFRQLLAKITSR